MRARPSFCRALVAWIRNWANGLNTPQLHDALAAAKAALRAELGR